MHAVESARIRLVSVEQMPPVDAEHLHQQIEPARRDHHVVGLVPLRDLVGEHLR